MAKRPSRIKGIFKILVILLVIGGLTYGVIKLSTVTFVTLNLKDVNCVEQSSMLHDLSIDGQNIFFIDDKKIEDKIKKRYLCINKLEIKTNYPNKVEVTAYGRQPVFIINKVLPKVPIDLTLYEATDSSQEAVPLIPLDDDKEEPTASASFLVDPTGFIFSNFSDEVLPKVYYVDQRLDLGSNIGAETITKLQQMLEKIKEIPFDINWLKVDNRSVYLSTDPQIYFSLDKDVNSQAVSLQLILQQAKMDSRALEKVDLRFTKAVVKYSPKKKG